MKTAVISFNSQGDIIAEKLKSLFSMDLDLYCKKHIEDFNINELTEKLMKDYKAIVFISSTGIAVRAIAPFIKTKDKDPAVVVIDILGKYVISLLSGHLGGANELTLKLSEIIGAVPIITTATDGLGIKAPDMIAKENGLLIGSLKTAKDLAALLVAGKRVAFIDEDNLISTPLGYSPSLEGAEGLVVVSNKVSDIGETNLITLKLIRKNIVLGIGCRKNYTPEKMKALVLGKMIELNIDNRSINTISTVEIKKDEKAILELSQYLNTELKIFTKDDIEKVQDKYKGSDFVLKSVGIRAVCEPCVELCGAKLLTSKLSLEGMTLCIGKI